MKKKLMNIVLGSHNPDLISGFDSVFDCIHIDWTKFSEVQLQTELINAKNSFRPDYIFMHTHCEIIRIETLKNLSLDCKVINWVGDVRSPLPEHYIDTGRNIFITLFSNMNDVITSRSRGIKSDFLQVGFDKNNFHPLGDKGNYPEILFLGSNYEDKFPLSAYRKQMVSTLQSVYGDRFGLYGGGWDVTRTISHLPHLPHLSKKTNSSLIRVANGNITDYSEEGKAYRSCKIAINLSHFSYSRYSSDRMFRILGSGTFCLSHRFPDIEKDFKIGEEIVVWDSIEDLINKINYYIVNHKERERIAMMGCALARKEYTWDRFAENLKLIIENE